MRHTKRRNSMPLSENGISKSLANDQIQVIVQILNCSRIDEFTQLPILVRMAKDILKALDTLADRVP